MTEPIDYVADLAAALVKAVDTVLEYAQYPPELLVEDDSDEHYSACEDFLGKAIDAARTELGWTEALEGGPK